MAELKIFTNGENKYIVDVFVEMLQDGRTILSIPEHTVHERNMVRLSKGYYAKKRLSSNERRELNNNEFLIINSK